MGEVVSLEEYRDHLAGEAFCTHCRHEWAAVVPIGTVDFECPNCGTMKGLFKHICAPEVVWQCECGGDLFYVTDDGFICRECGIQQEF